MNTNTQRKFADYTPAQKLDAIYDLAHNLGGDVYLAPVIDGKIFFQTACESFTEAPVIEEDITDVADLDRLCVITGGFHRFTLDEADDDIIFVSFPDDSKSGVGHVQIGGDESGAERALAALRRGLKGEDIWLAPYSSQDTAPILGPPLRKEPANDNSPHSKPAATPSLEPLPIINPANWQDQPIPKRRWLIPGLIPSRVVTLLSGDGGTGKTLLALQIGMATALDCEAWADLRPAAGRCLYVGAEDEADEFHRRMAAILDGFGRSFSDLTDFRLVSLADRDALLMTEHHGKMVETQLLQLVIDEAAALLPSLIVLDTAVDFFGGDEIKRAQVKQFLGALHRLAMSLDCAVLLLSHPSVAGIQTGTGTSGSTAWNGAVRSRLYLTAATEKDADQDARVLTTMKANFAAKGGKIGLRWDRGRFVLDDGSQTNPARAMLDKRADGIFLDLLSKLNRQGQNLSASPSQLYAPTVMAKQADAKGVRKTDLANSMQRLLDEGQIQILTEGPPSRPRKRLVVAAENFGPERQPSN